MQKIKNLGIRIRELKKRFSEDRKFAGRVGCGLATLCSVFLAVADNWPAAIAMFLVGQYMKLVGEMSASYKELIVTSQKMVEHNMVLGNELKRNKEIFDMIAAVPQGAHGELELQHGPDKMVQIHFHKVAERKLGLG